MESTSNNKKPFSWDDFEKGLMLAGLIPPSTMQEVNELEAIEVYEKELDKQKRSLYFRRVVLAAEIAEQLYSQSTFGRVKFQKLVYLCEQVAELETSNKYLKQAAGPFDNKFMHTIDKEFRKQKWFNVVKITENNIARYRYEPLENHGNHKKYFDSYFANPIAIHNIIDLFKNKKTDFTEIAATLYACHLELFVKHMEVNFEAVRVLFYSWSKEKKRFDEIQVKSIWNWLQENQLIRIAKV